MTSTSSERTSALDGEILVLLAELIDFVTHDVGVDAAVVGESRCSRSRRSGGFGDIADTDGIALPRDKRLGERERGRPARGAPPGEASGEGIDESAGVVMADASSSGSLVTESRSVPAPL
jgi:hypothetical protein